MRVPKPKVLFVDHETRLSGGEQDLLDLVVALGERVEAHVALPAMGPLGEALTAAGATVHLIAISKNLRKLSRWELSRHPWKLLKLPWGSLVWAFRLARLTASLHPDVVHTNSMKAHVLAAPGARISRIPLIWHVRDILEAGWLVRIFSILAWRLPDRVVCISRAVAQQFRGIAQHKTVVVYNGIDLARAGRGSAEAWRFKLGAKFGDLLVGILGQIARWKGQDVFIEAAKRVSHRFPHARFAIVGECLFPENEGDYEKALHRMTAELGLEGRLVFHGWTDEPEAVMRSFDIFVHASRLPEPFGRVIVEAMAAGRPVIASSVGAPDEIIREGEGILVPPGDGYALADAMTRFLSDAAERDVMGRGAANAANRFDISNTSGGVIDIYREIGIAGV